MRLISLIVGLIMTFGIVNQVYAFTSATKFISMVEKASGSDRSWLLTILRSQYTGLEWANAQLNVSGRKEVFCAPVKLYVKKEQVFKILKNYVENTKPGRKIAHIGSYGGVLLSAAIRKWPCRGLR